MIARGITPQSWTHAGLLILAGLGLVLLPFGPGRAQAPPKDEKPKEQVDQAEELVRWARARQEIEQAKVAEDVAKQRANLDAMKADLEAKLKQLQQAIEQLNAYAKPQTAQGGYGGAGANKPYFAPALPMGGGLGGGKALVQPGTVYGKGGNVEQRLDQVEKKLDTLLWEITNLRRDLARPPAVPAPPGMAPGGGFPGRPKTPPPASDSSSGTSSGSPTSGSSSSSGSVPRAVNRAGSDPL